MRGLVLVSALLASTTMGSKVPCIGYNQLYTLPVAGGHVIYQNHLWLASYWLNVYPAAGVPGWTDLGECEAIDPVPSCTAAPWDPTRVYDSPTTVTWNGAHWANKWWSAAGLYPSADNTGNWSKLTECSEGGTSVTNPPTTTSTATITSTSTPNVNTPPPATTTTPTTTPLVTAPAATTTTTAPGGVWDGGPVGPNGECVWPEYTTKEYCAGTYATMGGKVYSPSWCTTLAPPNTPWVYQADCSGTIKTKWTLEELIAQINPNGPEYQQIHDPVSILTQAAQAAIPLKEEELRTNSAAAASVVEVTRVISIEAIESIQPGMESNPENVKRVEQLIPECDFEKLFPVRHNSYTYTGFLRAIGAFPAYCQTYTDGRHSDDICKRMLATSFAHFTQEVGANWPSLTYGAQDGEHRSECADQFYKNGEAIPLWRQALWWVREMGYTENSFANAYRQCSIEESNRVWGLNFQCPANKDYYGRGSKQLSWNYNYGAFSKTFFNDALYLLENPNLVGDTWLNFASAVWFAVTPQNPKPAMLHVIDGTFVPNAVDIANGMTNSFAATIDIINGGIECRGGGTTQVQNRIAYYKEFMNYFGLTIDADEKLDCTGLPGFQAGSAGSVPTYLDKAGSGTECSLVSWQTPWKITVDNDYKACVDYYFFTHWVSKSEKKVVSSYGGSSQY